MTEDHKEMWAGIKSKVSTKILLPILIPCFILLIGFVGWTATEQIKMSRKVHSSQEGLAKQIVKVSHKLDIYAVKQQAQNLAWGNRLIITEENVETLFGKH